MEILIEAHIRVPSKFEGYTGLQRDNVEIIWEYKGIIARLYTVSWSSQGI